MTNVKEIGEEIAKAINDLHNPNIEYAMLDDFSDYSGRIFVGLKMEKVVGKYWFENHARPLRQISLQLHAVCKKMEREGKATCGSWDVPQPTYDSYGGYDGYEKDAISFDYDI